MSARLGPPFDGTPAASPLPLPIQNPQQPLVSQSPLPVVQVCLSPAPPRLSSHPPLPSAHRHSRASSIASSGGWETADTGSGSDATPPRSSRSRLGIAAAAAAAAVGIAQSPGAFRTSLAGCRNSRRVLSAAVPVGTPAADADDAQGGGGEETPPLATWRSSRYSLASGSEATEGGGAGSGRASFSHQLGLASAGDSPAPPPTAGAPPLSFAGEQSFPRRPSTTEAGAGAGAGGRNSSSARGLPPLALQRSAARPSRASFLVAAAAAAFARPWATTGGSRAGDSGGGGGGGSSGRSQADDAAEVDLDAPPMRRQLQPQGPREHLTASAVFRAEGSASLSPSSEPPPFPPLTRDEDGDAAFAGVIEPPPFPSLTHEADGDAVSAGIVHYPYHPPLHPPSPVFVRDVATLEDPPQPPLPPPPVVVQDVSVLEDPPPPPPPIDCRAPAPDSGRCGPAGRAVASSRSEASSESFDCRTGGATPGRGSPRVQRRSDGRGGGEVAKRSGPPVPASSELDASPGGGGGGAHPSSSGSVDEFDDDGSSACTADIVADMMFDAQVRARGGAQRDASQ